MDYIIHLNGTSQVWDIRNMPNSTIDCPVKKHIHGIEAIAGIQIMPLEFDTISTDLGQHYLKDTHLLQANCIQTLVSFLEKSADDYTLELQISQNGDFRGIQFSLLLKVLFLKMPEEDQVRQLFDGVKALLTPISYKLLTKNELSKIISSIEKYSYAVEIRRKVSLLATGNFGGLNKTQSEVPRLGMIKMKPKNSLNPIAGSQEFEMGWGFDEQFNYLVPVTENITPLTEMMKTPFATISNMASPVVVRILLSTTKITAYCKAFAANFYDLVQFTYRKNTFLKDDTVDGYLSVFQAIMHNDRLPVSQIIIQSEHKNTALVVSTAIQNHFGHTKFDCSFLNQPSIRPCSFHFQNFISPTKRWHIEAEIMLERMQYLLGHSEMSLVFSLPVIDTKQGPIPFKTRKFKPFHINFQDVEKDGIDLGIGIRNSNITGESFVIPSKNLVKNGLIVGVPGSGKTNSTMIIIENLLHQNIPFLILEPVKSEYIHSVSKLADKYGKKINYFQVESPYKEDKIDDSFLRFNPLIPYPGITIEQHLAYIHACITSAFPFYGLSSSVLLDCMTEMFKVKEFKDPVYGHKRNGMSLEDRHLFDPLYAPNYFAKKSTQHGDVITVNNDTVTLKVLSEIIGPYFLQNEAFYDPKMKEEMQGVLNRRLSLLGKGLLGHILTPELWRQKGESWSCIPDNIPQLLNENSIIDLQGIPSNEGKSLIMSFIFTYLYESRMLRKSHDGVNGLHATIIEEAHRLLSASSFQQNLGGDNAQTMNASSTFISLFTQGLAEFRAKNESLFVIEQNPTKLIGDVLKLTGTKIMHKLSSSEDRNYLSKAMNLDTAQTQYALHLQPGEAIVFTDGYSNAQLIKVHNHS